MKKVYKLLGAGLLVALLSVTALAQRPRTTATSAPEEKGTAPQAIPAAPTNAKAKYMGGVYGYNKKQEGTLHFDDTNKRLVFRDLHDKELISISYDAVTATFADSKSQRALGSTTGTVVTQSVGVLGLPALLFRKRSEYLTIQFKDPDTEVSGITSFKLKDKQQVASMVNALASKAGLTQRGEIFVRRKEPKTPDM